MTYIPEATRRLIAERADGRCEYCRLRQANTFITHEIDHIRAEKHGGASDESNLCFACADCNQHKGSDICSVDPDDNRSVVELFHPRRQAWDEHFHIRSDGMLEPLTANARVTVRLLQLNRAILVENRALLLLVNQY